MASSFCLRSAFFDISRRRSTSARSFRRTCVLMLLIQRISVLYNNVNILSVQIWVGLVTKGVWQECHKANVLIVNSKVPVSRALAA